MFTHSRLFCAGVLLTLGFAAQSVLAAPVSLGAITVDSHQTYYDQSNGTLAPLIPIPAGVTQIVFNFHGGVITDGSNLMASADGLYASGQTPYNFFQTNYGTGTYNGVRIGATTGIDPAIFGVFFSPTFSGTPQNSLDYRSGTGITPDPRTLLEYAPSLNQPFYIGDGFNQNTPFNSNMLDSNYVPPGIQQIFDVPQGAQYLILGIGADINMADNQNSAGQGGSFSDPNVVPLPPALASGMLLLCAMGAASVVVKRRAVGIWA